MRYSPKTVYTGAAAALALGALAGLSLPCTETREKPRYQTIDAAVGNQRTETLRIELPDVRGATVTATVYVQPEETSEIETVEEVIAAITMPLYFDDTGKRTWSDLQNSWLMLKYDGDASESDIAILLTKLEGSDEQELVADILQYLNNADLTKNLYAPLGHAKSALLAEQTLIKTGIKDEANKTYEESIAQAAADMITRGIEKQYAASEEKKWREFCVDAWKESGIKDCSDAGKKIQAKLDPKTQKALADGVIAEYTRLLHQLDESERSRPDYTPKEREERREELKSTIREVEIIINIGLPGNDWYHNDTRN